MEMLQLFDYIVFVQEDGTKNVLLQCIWKYVIVIQGQLFCVWRIKENERRGNYEWLIPKYVFRAFFFMIIYVI